MTPWMYRRHYHVMHGRDGFTLMARDRWLPGIAAETGANAFLAALGHPCCGRGLGRIPGVDYLAFRVLNAPNRLLRRDKRVMEIPLTVEQALTLQPSWAESYFLIDGTDEDGYTYQDAVMVGTPDGPPDWTRPAVMPLDWKGERT